MKWLLLLLDFLELLNCKALTVKFSFRSGTHRARIDKLTTLICSFLIHDGQCLNVFDMDFLGIKARIYKNINVFGVKNQQGSSCDAKMLMNKDDL